MPADGEDVVSDSCLFIWRNGTYSSFKVDISFSETFPEAGTHSFPMEGWTDDQYVLVQPEVLERLFIRGRTNSNYLSWRVRALGVNGEVVSSAPRRMLLATGKVPKIEELRELQRTLRRV